MKDLAPLYDLAFAIAPELKLADLKLLVHQSEWPHVPEARAYTIRGCFPPLRDYLRAAGEWQDAWPSAVVFVDPPSAELLIHELGHLLPATAPRPDRSPPVADDGDIEQRVADQTHDPPPMQPWELHEWRWIRRVLHLHYRAEEAGAQIPLEAVNVAGRHYGLGSSLEYQCILAGELEAFAGRLFWEIETAPPPPLLLGQFKHDITRYIEANYDDGSC